MSPGIVIRGGRRPVAPRFCLAGAMAVLLSACVGNSYMGIPLVSGQANPELQQLAARARAGDKQAQFELGIRFEQGNGVPQDKARAIKLYEQAASDSGGTMWVYSPSPGGGAPARVMPVDKGAREPGLEEAKKKLSAMDQRRNDK